MGLDEDEFKALQVQARKLNLDEKADSLRCALLSFSWFSSFLHT
jgi:hypothetical protein